MNVLQALMVESRQLESDLRSLPTEPRVVRAGTQATIDVSQSISNGTALLTIRDADGTVMYESDIGEDNADFTISFLATEGIPLVTKSLGGVQARNLRFWPATGRVQQKLTNTCVRDVEVGSPTSPGNGMELF